MDRELDGLIECAGITRFMEVQRITWIEHLKRKNDKTEVQIVVQWRPQGHNPRGRPRKTRMAYVFNKTIGIEASNRIDCDRDSVMRQAKIQRAA